MHIDQPMKTMASLIQQQRPPADIMLLLAREETGLGERLARAGRNDPCPCGSGKKFKHCHAAQAR